MLKRLNDTNLRLFFVLILVMQHEILKTLKPDTKGGNTGLDKGRMLCGFVQKNYLIKYCNPFISRKIY